MVLTWWEIESFYRLESVHDLNSILVRGLIIAHWYASESALGSKNYKGILCVSYLSNCNCTPGFPIQIFTHATLTKTLAIKCGFEVILN